MSPCSPVYPLCPANIHYVRSFIRFIRLTGVNIQMQAVLEYLKEHGSISQGELQELLSIKRTRAFTLIKQMSDAGLFKVEGRGANRRIILFN